ncbi:hypothetical protein JCM11491_001666 [Sporobolomyces phaffii]
MQLILKPSSDHPVPSAFHTHSLSPPKLPRARNLKVPAPYTKAKQSLNDLGLYVPSYLTADTALWWQFAIEHVEWNLETREVVVTLTDETEERWSLSQSRSSTILVDQEDEEDEVGEAGKEAAQAQSPPSTFKSRWSPDAVLARLLSLSIELRSAYEDITTSAYVDPSAPRLATDQDFHVLMSLAADPSLEIPLEWTRNQTPDSYFMDEELIDTGYDTDGDSGGTAEGDSGVEPRQGQFKSRRRPLRIDNSHEVAPSPSIPAFRRRSHDYLSLIDLLSQIRIYLLELLPATIYPRLKELLSPTYALWMADSAISWCRRHAIEQGCEVGIIILELLEDEPEAILDGGNLASVYEDSQDSSEEIDSEQGEESWGIEIRDGARFRDEKDSQWDAYVRMDKKRSDNPLDSMRDDFQLRCWAEDAIERQRAVEREQWPKKLAAPRWMTAPEPWEVSIPIDTEDDSSEFDEPFLTSSSKKCRPQPSRPRPGLASHANHPLASPPRAPQDDPFVSMPDRQLTLSSSPTSSSSELEPQSDPSSEPDATTYSDFFYPEDYLGEEFLPPKLPKAVVTASSSRGKDMERARVLLHAKLNEIAGLEKKLKELYEFSADQQGNYDDALEELKQMKDKHSTSASGLRTPRPSLADPPPSPRRKTVLPLKAQPLRHQTADQALTTRLTLALKRLEPSVAKQRKLGVGTNQAASNKRKVLSTPKPRKRQKFNLETLDKVIQLQDTIHRDSTSSTEGSTKKRRKPRQEPAALAEKSARANGSGGDLERGASKRSRKGRALRREDPVTDLGPVAIPPEPEPTALTDGTPSIALASAGSPSVKRLTILELSRRRPRLTSDDTVLPPSLGTSATVPSSCTTSLELSPSVPSDVESEGEATDEEMDPMTDEMELSFDFDLDFGYADDDRSVGGSGSIGSDDIRVFNESHTPSCSTPSPTASSARSQPLVDGGPSFAFPLSNSRSEYASYDPFVSTPSRYRPSSIAVVPFDAFPVHPPRSARETTPPPPAILRSRRPSLSYSDSSPLSPGSPYFPTAQTGRVPSSPTSPTTSTGIASRMLKTMSLVGTGLDGAEPPTHEQGGAGEATEASQEQVSAVGDGPERV